MFDYLDLEDGSVASYVTPVGQEKYYVFPICKIPLFQEKVRKSGEKYYAECA